MSNNIEKPACLDKSIQVNSETCDKEDKAPQINLSIEKAKYVNKAIQTEATGSKNEYPKDVAKSGQLKLSVEKCKHDNNVVKTGAQLINVNKAIQAEATGSNKENPNDVKSGQLKLNVEKSHSNNMVKSGAQLIDLTQVRISKPVPRKSLSLGGKVYEFQ